LVVLAASVACSSAQEAPASSAPPGSDAATNTPGSGGSSGGSTTPADAAAGGTGGRTGTEPPGQDAGDTQPDAEPTASVDSGGPAGGDAAEGGATGTIFVFTRTTAFRHPSIETAATALHDTLTPLGLTVEIGADPATFTTAGLSRFAGVVLVSTTGKPLGDPGTEALDALLAFVRAGGALVGIHGASATEYAPTLPYTPLLGGKMVDHPGSVRTAACHPAGQHPAVARLPAILTVYDEIYVMGNLSTDNQVDLNCDAFSGGGVLPIAWHRTEGQGRVYYTALGHGPEEYAASNPVFADHIVPAILWALGR
jgi:uncharacterized protein